MKKFYLIVLLLVFPKTLPAESLDCGPIIPNRQSDYRSAPKNLLADVERNHFTNQVESLKHGVTSGGDPFGDINYTLDMFYNHPRALWAISRYSRHPEFQQNINERINKARSTGRFLPTADCFFDRAIRFFPDDPIIYMLFGMHLHLSGKLGQAEKMYNQAEKLGLNSAEFYNNKGLLYFDIKDYKSARKNAEIAYRKGYPLPGLREKLKAIGEWN